MSDRVERVVEQLRERELDLLLVTDLVNVRYLTGFTGTNAAALVGDGRRTFLTDFRYLSQSAEEVPDWEREIASNDLLAGVARALPGEGALRVGFDDAQLPVKSHEHLREMVRGEVELVAASGLVEELRAIKDAEEIEHIRAAAQLADAALRDVLERGLAGRTERDVALDLEFTQRRLGAEAVSFPPIVAAAEHGALPHAQPRDREIPAGTLVVVDWGCRLDGYCSDCTRTFATGALDPRDRKVYELVAHAQEEALAAVRPGPTGRDVDAVAREIISRAGHAEHFGHGLGHGVGLDVHEGPRLATTSTTKLQPGHVVTVEPGVYVPQAVGVRIEDLVAVTEDGHEVLSSFTKELVTVA
ncbi:MAG TPA: Xaa-Pro peptidase family protein [Solirubrobacteraceae bacterium]